MQAQIRAGLDEPVIAQIVLQNDGMRNSAKGPKVNDRVGSRLVGHKCEAVRVDDIELAEAIVPDRIDTGAIAREDEGICSWAAPQDVVAGSSVEKVVPGTANQPVLARLTEQCIVFRPAAE
jgi:hypothetical protein